MISQLIVLLVLILLNAFFAASEIAFISLNDTKIEKQAKEARLEYKVLHRDTDTDELDIHLLTGRHHQIRLQLSNAGCPLLGDRKYGNERSIKYSDSQHIGSVRLTAYRLIFNDPQDGRRVSCTCT